MTETPDEQAGSSFTVRLPSNFKPERKPPRLTLSDDQLADLADATYTAAEVKVLTETASKYAYALGRKDALTEIADEMAVEQEYLSYVTFQTDRDTALLLMAAKTSWQEPQDASESRTDPGMDSDLPPEPQAVRSPQEDA